MTDEILPVKYRYAKQGDDTGNPTQLGFFSRKINIKQAHKARPGGIGL